MKNIIFLLILLVAIISLIFVSRLKFKHNFWDKQPVMREYSSDTDIIGTNCKFNINITDKEIKLIENDLNFDIIWKFLDEEFSEHLHINKEFFRYQYDISGALNISLYKNKNIIGFIHCHPINLEINGKNQVFGYVDFLCIKREHRNIDLATILICSVLNQTEDTSQPFIFKRDTSRLPFMPILESRYHYHIFTNEEKMKKTNLKNKSNRFIRKLDVTNDAEINKYLDYYNSLVGQFDLNKKMDLEELREMFIVRKVLNMYILKIDENEFETIIIGKDNKLDWFGKTLITFDIDNILGDMNNTKIQWDIFKKELLDSEYDFITVPFIGSNINFIIENKLQGANNYQYYFYNYKSNKFINEDFSFNIN